MFTLAGIIFKMMLHALYIAPALILNFSSYILVTFIESVKNDHSSKKKKKTVKNDQKIHKILNS
jgi:hypothetical protein